MGEVSTRKPKRPRILLSPDDLESLFSGHDVNRDGVVISMSLNANEARELLESLMSLVSSDNDPEEEMFT